jgi:hypothetical protein
MQNSSRFFLLLLALTLPAMVLRAQVRDLGDVSIKIDAKTISVTVSGATPEHDQLANVAFNAHQGDSVAYRKWRRLRYPLRSRRRRAGRGADSQGWGGSWRPRRFPAAPSAKPSSALRTSPWNA